jgi:hypothetical protein
MFSNLFSENRAIYEIMSKYVLELQKLQMTIWRRVAWSISEATHAQTHASARAPTHTCSRERPLAHARTQIYVILTDFPQQQWFRERASLLRYTHIACVVLFGCKCSSKNAADECCT